MDLTSASGATIICGNLILLARRIEFYNGSKIPLGGYWSIFGGRREPPSESPIQCAARELFEETGIRLGLSQLEHVKGLRSGLKFFDVYVAYLDHRPDVVLNEEHTEYGWFNLEHLEVSPSPTDPKMIRAILKHKRKS